MYRKTFKIKKAFLVAFFVDMVLLCLLLFLSLFLKGSSLERLVLSVIFITALLVFLEALSRKVLTGDQGILIRKFLREKRLLWEDITQVGTVVMRNRAYLLLTTTKGFQILTNAYGEFPELLREIADHVERERIDDDVRNQIEHPVKKISDIISTWFAAAVLVAIIVFKIITS